MIITTTTITSVEQLMAMPEVSDEEKILFWMREAKEAKHAKWMLEIAASNAVDAYESRFESINGSHWGPIDDEMKALNEALGKS